MKRKKTIFLTGATGNMGQEVLKQLLAHNDKFNIVALVLPGKKDRKIIATYSNTPGLKIIWGDLTNYDDVLRCVTGADYVLHVGGMVSPAADYLPELTMKVNIGSVDNIITAIQSQPDPDAVRLVYIGTVAETGDRNPPIHWGRVGDPVKISKFDNYAISKTIAERKVIECGLKYWVSLRQTGILYPALLTKLDPIMFHEPLRGVFEWVTAADSGRLLLHLCNVDLPDAFWKNVYNIGGGQAYRTMNFEFMQRTFQLLGIRDFTKAMEANWFATQNFHGQWYEDSDKLENYLHFRSGTLDDFLKEMKKQAPFSSRLAKFIPASWLKRFVFASVVRQEFGTLYWIKNDVREKINAFFGSRIKWEQIGTWDNLSIPQPSTVPIRLDHGYDENKPDQEIALEDVQQAAVFRGGKCHSPFMEKGNLSAILQWQCAFGHNFEATARLVLKTGHWCPHCFSMHDQYAEEAKRNAFFAQVWNPLQ